MINTYRITLHNPSANPEEFEEEYISAESQQAAETEAASIVARHPFNDVSLLSVELVTPGKLYESNHAS